MAELYRTDQNPGALKLWPKQILHLLPVQGAKILKEKKKAELGKKKVINWGSFLNSPTPCKKQRAGRAIGEVKFRIVGLLTLPQNQIGQSVASGNILKAHIHLRRKQVQHITEDCS